MLDETQYRDAGLLERLVAALRLDLALYQHVSADTAATNQAFRTVLLAGVSNGLGLAHRLGVIGVVAGVGAAVMGWFLWAAVILAVARLFGHHRHGRSLLRPVGFADAPGLFLIFGLVPIIGPLIRVVVVAWLVATTALAVQAVYDLSRWRASAIATSAFVVYLILGLVSAYVASG